MCRVSVMMEYARIMQKRGCGADRGDPPVCRVVLLDERTHADVAAELRDSGTAGEKQAIEVRPAIGMFQLIETGIDLQHESAATGDEPICSQGRQRHLSAGAAQQVDRGNCFYFLKSLGEDCENGGHTLS